MIRCLIGRLKEQPSAAVLTSKAKKIGINL